jgi:glutamate formiminotransferase
MVECVPNVSEGRRGEVVEALADAVRANRGVRLLDYSADPSHNRSVFTFIGQGAAVRDAALALFEIAVRRIDLRTHRGEHPRIGAVDVVPFVPLLESSMEDCVGLARQAGHSIATHHNVPVYLYEEAASIPERRALEHIRRGGLAGLGQRIADPAWRPDFGPSALHPTAGACVVGARMPLIAFNINLASDRLDVAQRIASTVRSSGGGLPNVKALGLWLADRRRAQVSMNLTDYRRTSIRQAYDAVRAQADVQGVEIESSELIGLAPAGALDAATAAHVQLRGFSPACILENRLGL